VAEDDCAAPEEVHHPEDANRHEQVAEVEQHRADLRPGRAFDQGRQVGGRGVGRLPRGDEAPDQGQERSGYEAQPERGSAEVVGVLDLEHLPSSL
jgi:hypothetical protein